MSGYTLALDLTEEEFEAVCGVMVALRIAHPRGVLLTGCIKMCHQAGVTINARMFDQNREFAATATVANGSVQDVSPSSEPSQP